MNEIFEKDVFFEIFEKKSISSIFSYYFLNYLQDYMDISLYLLSFKFLDYNSLD